ncbi:TPA: hypothetical protein EYP38_00035 [Candidatus Micrarchaeota archaeon]|nr:hypothetical protein [Candidatus Micrarchaeota archaeon]
MDNKIIIALCFFGLLVAFGCTETPETPPEEQPPGEEQPPVGSDRDEHGCIGSAGYTWCEAKQKCLREWEEPCEESAMSEEHAREIAQNSACTENGKLKDDKGTYNENTHTWWFDLNIDEPGCSPACVVDEGTDTAEINWRCTGLIPPEGDEPEEEQGEGDDPVCMKEGTQYGMTLNAAKEAAMNSLCTHNGQLSDNAVCNNVTGTWWIDIDMTTPKPGCNPACVVNVETKLPEVNWRCTGALPQ